MGKQCLEEIEGRLIKIGKEVITESNWGSFKNNDVLRNFI